MFINDDLRKLLLGPTLDGSLRHPVEDLVLHTPEGPVSLTGMLTLTPGSSRFQLEVRDGEGRDFRSFFKAGNKVSPADTLQASGVLGNRLRVSFERIWPPTSSTTRPIGEVKASSAILNPEVIVLPRTSADFRDGWRRRHHSETSSRTRRGASGALRALRRICRHEAEFFEPREHVEGGPSILGRTARIEN